MTIVQVSCHEPETALLILGLIGAEMELCAAELYAKLDFLSDKYHEVVRTCTLDAILDTLNKVDL